MQNNDGKSTAFLAFVITEPIQGILKCYMKATDETLLAETVLYGLENIDTSAIFIRIGVIFALKMTCVQRCSHPSPLPSSLTHKVQKFNELLHLIKYANWIT